MVEVGFGGHKGVGMAKLKIGGPSLMQMKCMITACGFGMALIFVNQGHHRSSFSEGSQ